MTDTDNQERIAQIRSRLERATPGPWTYEAEMRPINEFAHFQIKTVEPQPDAPWSQRFIAWMTGGRDISARRFHELSRYEQDKLIDAGVRPDKRCEFDAAFIASAPTDLAFLLSRVDALESALREAQKDRDAVIRECANVADAELRALYAEYRDTHRDEQECAQAIRNNILAKLSEFSRADTGENT